MHKQAAEMAESAECFIAETSEFAEKGCRLVARATRETDRETLRFASVTRVIRRLRPQHLSIGRRPSAGATSRYLCDPCDLCVENTLLTPLFSEASSY
jgi:hypothetical protein